MIRARPNTGGPTEICGTDMVFNEPDKKKITHNCFDEGVLRSKEKLFYRMRYRKYGKKQS